jgi:hypothetical protein
MSSMNWRTKHDPAPRSFIVRIYRQTADGPVGQVQNALTGRVRAFRDLAHLLSALGCCPQSSRDASSLHRILTDDKEHS